MGRQQKNAGIDEKGEKANCVKIYWKASKNNEWPDKRIEKPEDYSYSYGRSQLFGQRSWDRNSGQQTGHHQDGDCLDQRHDGYTNQNTQ